MPYELREETPSVETYLSLRDAADMSPRSPDGAARGLANSLYAVTIRADDDVVGMGRVVGDGGTVYQLVDWVTETAPPHAYVNLMADVDGFYERFGFEETRPASKWMYLRVEDE